MLRGSTAPSVLIVQHFYTIKQNCSILTLHCKLLALNSNHNSRHVLLNRLFGRHTPWVINKMCNHYAWPGKTPRILHKSGLQLVIPAPKYCCPLLHLNLQQHQQPVDEVTNLQWWTLTTENVTETAFKKSFDFFFCTKIYFPMVNTINKLRVLYLKSCIKG